MNCLHLLSLRCEVPPPALPPKGVPVLGVRGFQKSAVGRLPLEVPNPPPPGFVKPPAASESACWGNTKDESFFHAHIGCPLLSCNLRTPGSPPGIYVPGSTDIPYLLPPPKPRHSEKPCTICRLGLWSSPTRRTCLHLIPIFFFFFFPAFRLSVCARLCPIALSSRLSPSPYAPTRPHPEVPTLHGAGGRFASLHLPFRLTPGDSSCRCAGRWHKKQYTTAVTQARIKSGRATLWMDAQGRRGTGQPEPSSAIVVLSRSCIGPASAGARGASRRAAARTGSGSPPSALRPLPAQTCLGPAPTHSGDVRQRGGI